ncbi:efflux RND transporter periplasmic adaptor subunit [Lacibacterium aquatile]|uniref:Efflux RND transporter periplasmic adaptor subunit n=1 Tax=Lacibacterium aquatile TaxID=1168082 RepID=A0ABW5DT93_9PROT
MRYVWGALLLVVLPVWTAVAEDIPARIVPVREAVLSADMAGRIVAFPLTEGAAFKKGDLLLALDCSEPQARLNAADATRSGAEKVLEARRKLNQLGSATQLEMALAESDLARARGEVQVIRAMAAKCEVRAPFDGRLVKRRAQLAESATIGHPLLEIIDDRQLEVDLLVPSGWAGWLKLGTELTVAIAETGRRYKASVSNLGARIDPVSQSLPVKATIVGEREGLLAGMSGVAVFNRP